MVQVRVLVEMPAWVLSVTLASEAIKQGVENAVFVSDADANIKRLPVSLTLEPDTCTIKCASPPPTLFSHSPPPNNRPFHNTV